MGFEVERGLIKICYGFSPLSQAFLGFSPVIQDSTCNLQAGNVQRPILDLVL